MKKFYFSKAKNLLRLLLLVPFLSFAQIDLLQTTNNTVTQAAFSCGGANNVTFANSYARLYNLTDLGYSSFDVTKVSFGVHGFTLGSAATYAVNVEVYASNGGVVTNNLTYIGGTTVNITAAMVGTVVEASFATALSVSSPQMLIVVSTPDGQPTQSGFYIGANSNGQTAPAYIKAAGCGANDFTSFSDLGGSNMHVVLFPTGNPTLIPECPPGDITFNTQAEVDQFIIDYPNCTTIAGALFISGIDNSPTNIADLSPLNNITNVEGFFQLYLNPLLTNLNGLSNLTSISGYLLIDNNSGLNNLSGLNALTNISQDINILNNPVLTDISALQNTTFAPADGYGLTIFNNPALAVCNLPNFCNYLANPSDTHPRDISGNLTECINEEAVVAACTTMGIDDFESTAVTAYPNPIENVLNVSSANEISNLTVVNMLGQTVLSKTVQSTEVQMDLSTLPAGSYFVKVSAGQSVKTIKILKQ